MKVIINEPFDELMVGYVKDNRINDIILSFWNGGSLHVISKTKQLAELLKQIRDGKVKGRPLKNLSIGRRRILDIDIRPETILARPVSCEPSGYERNVALVFKERNGGKLIVTITPEEARDILDYWYQQ